MHSIRRKNFAKTSLYSADKIFKYNIPLIFPFIADSSGHLFECFPSFVRSLAWMRSQGEVVACIVECRRGESHKNRDPPISLALPSFLSLPRSSPFLSFTVFFWPFYPANLTVVHKRSVCYGRLCDCRNDALKNLRTSSAAFVWFTLIDPSGLALSVAVCIFNSSESEMLTLSERFQCRRYNRK